MGTVSNSYTVRYVVSCIVHNEVFMRSVNNGNKIWHVQFLVVYNR